MTNIIEKLMEALTYKRAALHEVFLYEHRYHNPPPLVELYTDDALRTCIRCGCGEILETTLVMTLVPVRSYMKANVKVLKGVA